MLEKNEIYSLSCLFNYYLQAEISAVIVHYFLNQPFFRTYCCDNTTYTNYIFKKLSCTSNIS